MTGIAKSLLVAVIVCAMCIDVQRWGRASRIPLWPRSCSRAWTCRAASGRCPVPVTARWPPPDELKRADRLVKTQGGDTCADLALSAAD